MYDKRKENGTPIDVQMEKLCYHGLCNLSLNLTVHEIIWQPQNLRLIYEFVLYHFMKTIKFKSSEDLKKATKIVHINSYTYLYGLRIITNCIITKSLQEKLLKEN